MAQRVTVVFIDDLDGSRDRVSTVEFSLDGVTYEIDLSLENEDRLRAGLAEFVNAARRTSRRRKALSPRPRTDLTSMATGSEAPLIRVWARQHGYAVSDHGRLPGRVVQDYRHDRDRRANPPDGGNGGHPTGSVAQ